MDVKNNQPYYLAAITAFIVWGFFPIEIRLMRGFDAGAILYFRILFAFLLLAILAFVRRNVWHANLDIFQKSTKAEKSTLVWGSVIGSALLASNWLAFIYVVNHVSVKTASFSYFICPVLTAVFGFILLKESLLPLQWIAVTLCFISCIIIGLESISDMGFSLLIAATYALYLIFQRKNGSYDRLLVLTFQLFFSLCILSPVYTLLVHHAPIELTFYGHTLFISIVFTIFPLFLNLFALKKLPSATIGMLMYLNPVVGFTSAILFYQEKVSILHILAYVLIGLAILLFNAKNILGLRMKSS